MQIGLGDFSLKCGSRRPRPESMGSEPSEIFLPNKPSSFPVQLCFPTRGQWSIVLIRDESCRTHCTTGIPAFGNDIEDPGPGEVQVQVQAVGVCGSDLHAYSVGAVGSTPNVYPMVLGHEPAGTIVNVGSGCRAPVGDGGALEPASIVITVFCLRGHHNVCANLRFLSNPHFRALSVKG